MTNLERAAAIAAERGWPLVAVYRGWPVYSDGHRYFTASPWEMDNEQTRDVVERAGYTYDYESSKRVLGQSGYTLEQIRGDIDAFEAAR